MASFAPFRFLSRISLRTKIVVMAGVLAVVPALVVAGIRINEQQQNLRTAGLELQLALLHDLAESCEHTLDQARADLEAIALTLTRANLNDDARLELALTFVESSPMIDHVDVYDRRGQWVDRIEQNPQLTPAPKTLPALLREGTQNRGEVLGEVQKTDSQLRIPMIIALVVDTQVTGFIRSSIALGPLQQRLEYLARGHLSGLSDALYIVDEKQRIIAHTSRDRLLQSAHDDPMIAPLKVEHMAPQVGLSREMPDSEGREGFVGTALKLKYRPWVLATRVPISVAYRPWLDQRRLLVYLIAGTIVLALLLGTIFARFITEPLIALRQMASRLVKHRFDHTALLAREDELGQLAQAMQQAALELRSDMGSDMGSDLGSNDIPPDSSPAQTTSTSDASAPSALAPNKEVTKPYAAFRSFQSASQSRDALSVGGPVSDLARQLAAEMSSDSASRQSPALTLEPSREDEPPPPPAEAEPLFAFFSVVSIRIPDAFVREYGPQPATEVYQALQASLREYLHQHPETNFSYIFPDGQLLLWWPAETSDLSSILETLVDLQERCLTHPERNAFEEHERALIALGLHQGEIFLEAAPTASTRGAPGADEYQEQDSGKHGLPAEQTRDTSTGNAARAWGHAIELALSAQLRATPATIWISAELQDAVGPSLHWLSSKPTPNPHMVENSCLWVRLDLEA